MKKLFSRKFLLTLLCFICLMIVYLKSGESEPLIGACSSVIAYVLGEAYTDGKGGKFNE